MSALAKISEMPGNINAILQFSNRQQRLEKAFDEYLCHEDITRYMKFGETMQAFPSHIYIFTLESTEEQYWLVILVH